jgi:hypothetical protein
VTWNPIAVDLPAVWEGEADAVEGPATRDLTASR